MKHIKTVILAAGQGTRLRPLTNQQPKCMVPLLNKPLLYHQRDVLHQCGLSDITVVAGYQHTAINRDDFHVVINENYATTNMVASLFCARDVFDGTHDIVVAYGDIVYEPFVIQQLLTAEAPIALVVDKGWRRYWSQRMDNPLTDAETLKLNAEGCVIELGKRAQHYQDIEGQYIGLFKISKQDAKAFLSIYQQMDRTINYDGQCFDNMYMTSYLHYLINLAWQVKAVPIQHGWLETDTLGDLELYENLHEQGKLTQFYKSLS